MNEFKIYVAQAVRSCCAISATARSSVNHIGSLKRSGYAGTGSGGRYASNATATTRAINAMVRCRDCLGRIAADTIEGLPMHTIYINLY